MPSWRNGTPISPVPPGCRELGTLIQALLPPDRTGAVACPPRRRIRRTPAAVALLLLTCGQALPAAAAGAVSVPAAIALPATTPAAGDPAATPPAAIQAPATRPASGEPAGPEPATVRNRRLVLDRKRRLLTLLEDGRTLHRYPVAVGMPGWETPVGSFRVLEMTVDPSWQHPASGVVIPPGPANPLGSRWIGFHRDCRGRRGFNGQEHLVVRGCVTAGFHGTPNRASVGRAVSHGCVRLYDEHARQLFDLVQVGTPVTVLP